MTFRWLLFIYLFIILYWHQLLIVSYYYYSTFLEKKDSYYMPAGSKTNLGGSCIYYRE